MGETFEQYDYNVWRPRSPLWRRLWYEVQSEFRSEWRHWLWRLGVWPGVVLNPNLRISVAGYVRGLVSWRRVVLKDPCPFCHAQATTIDHVVPSSRGGSDNWWNLVGACKGCNMGKGNQGLLLFLVAERKRGAKQTPVVTRASTVARKKKNRATVKEWAAASTSLRGQVLRDELVRKGIVKPAETA